MSSQFGAVLKQWRGKRHLSQLDLALKANVSSRHISFLETGRSSPSRAMILHLCEQLEVPPFARNGFLNAAGFSPAYKSRDLQDEEMRHVHRAVEWMLERHAPYPAMALDKHWVVKLANQPAGFLLSGAGISVGDSLLDLFADPEKMGMILDNAHEVMQHMLIRLKTESAYLGGDKILDHAAERLSNALGSHMLDETIMNSAVIPARYRAGTGETVLSFFSTIASFGTAQDIALSELKIELLFPADDKTEQMLLQLQAEFNG